MTRTQITESGKILAQAVRLTPNSVYRQTNDEFMNETMISFTLNFALHCAYRRDRGRSLIRKVGRMFDAALGISYITEPNILQRNHFRRQVLHDSQMQQKLQ